MLIKLKRIKVFPCWTNHRCFLMWTSFISWKCLPEYPTVGFQTDRLWRREDTPTPVFMYLQSFTQYIVSFEQSVAAFHFTVSSSTHFMINRWFLLTLKNVFYSGPSTVQKWIKSRKENPKKDSTQVNICEYDSYSWVLVNCGLAAFLLNTLVTGCHFFIPPFINAGLNERFNGNNINTVWRNSGFRLNLNSMQLR